MKLIVFIFLFFSIYSFGQQPTIGLRLSTNQAADGYTLFTPERNKVVYLINNCGQVVNSWEFSENPAITCYLLENGNLLRAGVDSLEIRDWNNNLVWSYATTLNGFPQHHDIEPLPNGNILIVSRETFDATAIVEMGRNPALGNSSLILDAIYELKPIGMNEAELVWQWKFSDHLVQEFDNSKSNFGVVASSPELMDLNFDNSQATDYTHVNAIDYNPVLDEIIITARHLSELFIIDHSTTALEASTHSGGNKGKGGDFLYRWGNPQVYQGGAASDQMLHLPHDGKWVNEGCPNYGQLSVFNNLGNGVEQASSVHVFAPSIVNDVYQMNSNKYLPIDYSWSWSGSVLGNIVYETKKCGMMELQNGNHLVCENSTGTLFEIAPNKDIVWIYKNPSAYNAYIYQQDEVLSVNDNILFRGERYAPDFIGFEGKNLTPQGTIENENTLTESCLISASLVDQVLSSFKIENPVVGQSIRFLSPVSCDELVVVNLNGEIIQQVSNFNGQSLQLNSSPGIYFLKMRTGEIYSNQKMIIL